MPFLLSTTVSSAELTFVIVNCCHFNSVFQMAAISSQLFKIFSYCCHSMYCSSQYFHTSPHQTHSLSFYLRSTQICIQLYYITISHKPGVVMVGTLGNVLHLQVRFRCWYMMIHHFESAVAHLVCQECVRGMGNWAHQCQTT